MHALLAGLGHDVLSARETAPRATDSALLALQPTRTACSSRKTKDFGELVFVHRLPHPCIIHFVDMQVAEKVAAMRELLDHHEDSMHEGALIVVTRSRVRIRTGRRKARGED